MATMNRDDAIGLPEPAHTVPTIRWQRHVPEAICSLDTLAGPDYMDVFTARTHDAESRTPEQWARTALDGGSVLVRLAPLAQRVLLGLRLGPRRSPGYVGGWKIADLGDSWIRLEAASWLLTGHLILKVDDGQLSIATFVRYRRLIAALIWPPVSLIHRQVGLALMRQVLRAR